MTEKQESVMMSRIVDSLEYMVKRNFEIKEGMKYGLSEIYPSHIEQEIKSESMCKEEPRDYCHKISMLLAELEEVTSGHEENLRHLRQIV
jgi:hypothetical protein